MLDVRSILYKPGEKLDFHFTLDLSDTEIYGRYPINQPVTVTGTVYNNADVLTLELTARTVLDACCDRCGKEFPLDKEVSYHCFLAEEIQNEDNSEIVLLQNGQVDVEELSRTAFILDMDTRILCAEDCKGLCPRCGVNLNFGTCSCKKEPDPRLAVLAKWLK